MRSSWNAFHWPTTHTLRRSSIACGVRFGVHVCSDNRERAPPLLRLRAVWGPGDDGSPRITTCCRAMTNGPRAAESRVREAEAISPGGAVADTAGAARCAERPGGPHARGQR